MKKRTLSIILALAMLLLSTVGLAACGGEKPLIGIIQFGSHGSLNNCYTGIEKALAAAGYTAESCQIERVNSNFDPSVSQSQANMLVNRGAKVIIAIATPSAVAAANAAADSGIPVVFCAITDAGVMANYDNVTGSSDVPNFMKQLGVVSSFMKKDTLKIGVLYSTEESSSPYQVEQLKMAAALVSSVAIDIVDRAVADINTIDTHVSALIDEGVDCFVNLLDNTIVGKLESNILPLTNEAGIPVFGSELEQVKLGCVASASMDYVTVGEKAGEAAAAILGGKAAKDIPVAVITAPQNYYNSKACALLGIEVPADPALIDVAE